MNPQPAVPRRPLPDHPSASGIPDIPGAAAGPGGAEYPRMELLAQIAGGIAPALSDLLTIIRGQAEVLLDKPGREAAELEALKQIYTAAEKAGSLMRQLLIFSRHQTPRIVPMDLNNLINETAAVLQRLVGGKIALELGLDPSLPLILADAGMLEQILVILAMNAHDAMPDGGSLLFTTGLEDRPAALDKSQAGGPQPTSVVLTAEDTGKGIPPEILPRIFEPFFTTKAEGRSAGLGLATVFGIAQQHHGRVTAENLAAGGLRIRVFLPVAPHGSAVPFAGGPSDSETSGPVTILLLEDDAVVREFTAMVLREAGYRVLQAGTATDALEAWKWHGSRIRLLLTDMVLDDAMSGLQLAARLRAEAPGLKVLCTSGHRRDTMKRFPELSEGYEFIQKPCRPQALLAALRRLLAEINS